MQPGFLKCDHKSLEFHCSIFSADQRWDFGTQSFLHVVYLKDSDLLIRMKTLNTIHGNLLIVLVTRRVQKVAENLKLIRDGEILTVLI